MSDQSPSAGTAAPEPCDDERVPVEWSDLYWAIEMIATAHPEGHWRLTRLRAALGPVHSD